MNYNEVMNHLMSSIKLLSQDLEKSDISNEMKEKLETVRNQLMDLVHPIANAYNVKTDMRFTMSPDGVVESNLIV